MIFLILGMIGASMLLSNYEVGPKIEACFQNFAAGLIIAAGNVTDSLFSSNISLTLTHSFVTVLSCSGWRAVPNHGK